MTRLITLFIVLILNAVFIIMYFFSLRKTYGGEDMSNHDIMNQKVIDIPEISPNCCSWWPISHLIMFAIYSYIWPEYGVILFVMGALWEVVEGIINNINAKADDSPVVRHQTTTDFDGTLEYVTWWQASTKDILFNGLGIVLGKIIRYLI